MTEFLKVQFSSDLACELCQCALPAASDVWMSQGDYRGVPKARCYPNCQEQPLHLAQQEMRMARFRRRRK